jgi:hypothetical protein
VFIVATFGPQVAARIPDLGPGAYAVAIAYAVLLLISVLAHEAAHAVVATRAGYRVDRVVADLWGGHTAYDSSTARPGASAMVAIAGPAANALLALVAWLVLPGVPDGISLLLVGAMLYANAFVAGFNMLPGLPLDGGFLVDSSSGRSPEARERADRRGLVRAWRSRSLSSCVRGAAAAERRASRPVQSRLGLPDRVLPWVGATNAIRSGRGSRLAGRHIH